MSHIPGAVWVNPDDNDVTGVVNQLSSTTPGVYYDDNQYINDICSISVRK